MSQAPEDNQTKISPFESMYDRITASMTQQMLYEITRLGIPDLIKEGISSVDVIAEKTETDARVLNRVLRALASNGLFTETEDRHFELTAETQFLCADAEISLRSLLMLIGSPWHLNAWTHLSHSLRTGQPAFDEAHGDPMFDYLQQHPEHSNVYGNAMTGRTGAIAQAVASSYDFSRVETLMDVGGGEGMFLSTILSMVPGLSGILFDLPGISNANKEVLANSGTADRCQIVEGSFFDRIPAGADAIIMKSIIHDWNDQSSHKILNSCRKALPKSGTLLLCEFIVPGKNLPGLAKVMDVEMLVMSGGAERTEAEYRALLAANGFSLDRLIPTPTNFFLLECSIA